MWGELVNLLVLNFFYVVRLVPLEDPGFREPKCVKVPEPLNASSLRFLNWWGDA